MKDFIKAVLKVGFYCMGGGVYAALAVLYIKDAIDTNNEYMNRNKS